MIKLHSLEGVAVVSIVGVFALLSSVFYILWRRAETRWKEYHRNAAMIIPTAPTIASMGGHIESLPNATRATTSTMIPPTKANDNLAITRTTPEAYHKTAGLTLKQKRTPRSEIKRRPELEPAKRSPQFV